MTATYKVPTEGYTQCQIVAMHVEANGGITTWEAINTYGISRLAARVNDLKNTEAALKAEEIGGGFVRYVPDYEARAQYWRTKLNNLLFFSSPEEITAKVEFYAKKYTENMSKHLRLNHKPKLRVV